MIQGFTYKGIHSNEYGIVKTISRPLLPAVKTALAANSNRDGTDDFTIYNSRGRYAFEDRIFTVTLQVKLNPANMYTKLDKIKEWLIGKGKLIFDNEPNKIWKARCYDNIDFAPQLLGNYTELQISFRVEPFAISEEQSIEVSIKAGEKKNIEINAGTYYTAPILEFTSGNVGFFSFKRKENVFALFADRDMNLYYKGDMAELIIDCKNKHCYKSDATGMLEYWYGDFIEFTNGVNEAELYSDVDVTVLIKYYKKYL